MRPSTFLIFLGIVLLIGGVLAIANPFAATLTATTLVGVLLVLSGVGQLWTAFAGGDLPHRLWTGLIGLLGVVVGVDLLANPLAGMVSLTVLVGVLFLVMGAIRLYIAFRLREAPLFWPFLIAGAASILIGGMIFADVMAAATTLLGLLLGIQLLADGVALVALGLLARRL